MTAVATARQWLIAHLADYLDLRPGDIDPAAPLRSYGLNSLYALTLNADIHDTFGLLVDPTLAWDHPTIDAIASYIASHCHDRDIQD